MSTNFQQFVLVVLSYFCLIFATTKIFIVCLIVNKNKTNLRRIAHKLSTFCHFYHSLARPLTPASGSSVKVGFYLLPHSRIPKFKVLGILLWLLPQKSARKALVDNVLTWLMSLLQRSPMIWREAEGVTCWMSWQLRGSTCCCWCPEIGCFWSRE